MGLTRSSFMRAMVFQSTTKFLPGSRWVLGSLLFIADKFGDLNLQEPKLHEVVGSGTGCLPPAPIRVDLINEAQLRHRLNKLGKMDLDHTEDKVDHTLAIPVALTDPIHQSSPEPNTKGDKEFYMVGQGEELPEKTAEEIPWEADEEIAQATHLAWDAKRRKKHNGLQDNSGASDDETRDGAPTRRHHPKFNSRCPIDQDRLQDRSRSI
jgi:hypothetical protein